MQPLLDRTKLFAESATGGSVYKNMKRLECQTDILFLARLLGYDKVLDDVHQSVADLCVRKNPALPIEMQDEIKDRMHLDPRGTFKTTLSIVDSIQWIICFPNVRICQLTGTIELANAIVGEVADKFIKDDIDEPTDFQLLFPEYLITRKDKRVGLYTAPCRTINWKEQTMMAFSNEKTMSGWHFDVGNLDDVVNPVNNATPTGIEKVKSNWRTNRKTMMPWAYRHYKGTRHSPFELYGDMIDKMDPDVPQLKLLVRGALKLKNKKRLERGKFPAENEVELLFPELLSYNFLKKEFDDDYESFMNQYMNDPQGAYDIVFTAESLKEATRKHEEVPISGEVTIVWRMGYGEFKHAAAAVGLVERGRMYIVDVVHGIFKPSTLAHEVVALAKRYGVNRIQIEDTPGARYNEPAIKNYAATMNWPLEIYWKEFQEDDAVRDLRMKSAEPLISTGRLLFADSMEELKETTRQFKNYGLLDTKAIVDAVSQVAETLPKSIVTQDLDAEQDLQWELLKRRDQHNRIHGLGQYAPLEPVIEEKPWMPEPNSYGLDEIMPGLNG